MATTVAHLQAKLTADTRDFDRGLDTSGSKLKSFGKVAALGLGAAGVGGVIAVLKTGFDELGESQKVMAQTEAVIKSTGSSANVTKRQVEGLATSLSKMSGVDDEAIQSGENMLLTFTKIRNEVGKGNDIFNQATTATLNLSVAMGKDMQSSAILVGKALNDPIKGMSALGRAGIQFTAAQKEQIKALVASGDAMGAQKLILKELETQFGGSAQAFGETMPGQISKAKIAFEETSAKIMEKLLPAITAILSGFLGLITWLDENPPGVIWGRFVDGTKTKFEEIKAAIKERIDAAVTFITNLPGRMWTGFVTFWLESFYNPVKAKFVALKEGIVEAITSLPGDVWTVVAGIGTKITEMVDTIKGWGTGAAGWIKGAVADGLTGIGVAVWDKINNIWDYLLAKKDTVMSWGAKLGGWIKDAIIGALAGLGSGIWDAVSGSVSSVIDKLPGRGDPPGGGMPVSVPGSELIGVGRYLQGLGFQVGEHPAFGGVQGRHATNSYHYRGRAIDVNWPGGGPAEYSKLRSIFGTLAGKPHAELMIEDALQQNQHLHYAMAQGGIFTKPTTGLFTAGESGREAFIPLDNPRARDMIGGGDLHVHFHNSVVSRDQQLLAMLQPVVDRWQSRNGRPAFGT